MKILRRKEVEELLSSARAKDERRQAAAGPQKVETIVRGQPKVGRNDPCPCGSGKKFKKCCGRNL